MNPIAASEALAGLRRVSELTRLTADYVDRVLDKANDNTPATTPTFQVQNAWLPDAC